METFTKLRGQPSPLLYTTVSPIRHCVRGSPRKITFVAELPKTATGKLKRFVLRDQAVLQRLSMNRE